MRMIRPLFYPVMFFILNNFTHIVEDHFVGIGLLLMRDGVTLIGWAQT